MRDSSNYMWLQPEIENNKNALYSNVSKTDVYVFYLLYAFDSFDKLASDGQRQIPLGKRKQARRFVYLADSVQILQSSKSTPYKPIPWIKSVHVSF
jgi:hypothetical protein